MFIDRTTMVAIKLRELGLNPGHLIVITEVNPSRSLPYHNSHHCLSVALNAEEGARFTGLGIEDRRTLFIAGLYHDFNHSGGANPDSVNVADAAAHMKAWCRLLEDFTEGQLESIHTTILSTRWPYDEVPGETTMVEDILCDADLMQWTEPDTKDFMEGLGAEKNEVITLADTRKFLTENPPRTPWGKKRIDAWLANPVNRS